MLKFYRFQAETWSVCSITNKFDTSIFCKPHPNIYKAFQKEKKRKKNSFKKAIQNEKVNKANLDFFSLHSLLQAKKDD